MKVKHRMSARRKKLIEEGSKPPLVDTVTGVAIMLARDIDKVVDARLSDRVDERIREMHEQNYWLPPLWEDLSAAVERLARDDYGTTLNQVMMKRAHIERVEELCRQIGVGGTFYADKPVNH